MVVPHQKLFELLKLVLIIHITHSRCCIKCGMEDLSLSFGLILLKGTTNCNLSVLILSFLDKIKRYRNIYYASIGERD